MSSPVRQCWVGETHTIGVRQDGMNQNTRIHNSLCRAYEILLIPLSNRPQDGDLSTLVAGR